MIKLIFSLILFSFYCLSAFAASEITGRYKCSVFDPKNNSHYDETLTVEKTGDTYRMLYYSSPDSTAPYIMGTGILTENSFASFNWSPSESWRGIALFAVKDNSLDGTWATLNKQQVGTETCNKT